MVNIHEFTNRLKKILEVHQLTASFFADKIGVQRSSISHILSGRNKPSLDFILKVTTTFQDVDLEWLLHGAGIYPKISQNTSSPTQNAIVSGREKSKLKNIERIVVFYTDGTFEEYNH